MRSVLITAPFDSDQIRRLERAGATVWYEPWTNNGQPHPTSRLRELVESASADTVVVELEQVTREVMAIDGLETIACCRSGLPNIDLAAARELGLRVVRAPGRNVQAVAEYTLATIILALRHVIAAREYVLRDAWDGSERTYVRFRGDELESRSVVLHGFGAVGRRVADLLAPFECRVSVIDPFVDSSTVPRGVQLLDAEEGYASADILSVHLPMTEATRGLVNRELLRRLAAHALFVNTARADVVDYDALADVLRDGSIAGAVLDVFRVEPVTGADLELCRLPNVIATPHIAGATHDVVRHHSRIIADALIALAEGDEVDAAYIAA